MDDETQMGPTSLYTWRRTDNIGTCLVRVDHQPGRIAIDGSEVLDGPDGRYAARFGVELDDEWRHRSTWVEVLDADGYRRVELDDLDGADVVDIGATPFTNTFVLHGAPADEFAVEVAYVEVPALSVRRMTQRYRRLAPDRWEYSDDEFGTFRLTVDGDGVPLTYEGLAERVR